MEANTSEKFESAGVPLDNRYHKKLQHKNDSISLKNHYHL